MPSEGGFSLMNIWVGMTYELSQVSPRFLTLYEVPLLLLDIVFLTVDPLAALSSLL